MRPASQRFLTHIAWARSIARRWRFIEDIEQAALLGLHLADVTAAPDMPDADFLRYAVTRVRGEAIDHLRRVGHGRRPRGIRVGRPRDPEPESVAMAIDMGLIGSLVVRPSAERQVFAREVAQRVDSLPARSRDVLLRRLAGEPEAMIGRDYGISCMRVSQIAWAAARAVAEPRRPRATAPLPLTPAQEHVS